MKQLTVQDLKLAIAKFEYQNPGIDIKKVPVYIGDDEELNGVHDAYFAEEAHRNKPQDECIFESIDTCTWGEDTSKIKTIFLIS